MQVNFSKEDTPVASIARARLEASRVKVRRCQWSSTSSGAPLNIVNTRSAPDKAWSSPRLKQRRVPVEGPSIIYEVEDASTALARGIDPLGIRCSKKHW